MKLYSKSKSALSNDNGIALPLVLMIMIILVLFGTAAYTASQSSLKQSMRLDPTLQCKYLARSAVDATKENWISQWRYDPNSVPTDETFYTKFNVTSEEFEDVDPSLANQDYVIKTEQRYNSGTGICTIASSVKIGTHSATVRAKSEKITDTVIAGTTTTNPWYGYKEYKIELTLLPDPKWYRWTLLPGPEDRIVRDKDNREYHATYHTTEGNVSINTNASNSEVLYANGTMWDDVYISNLNDFFSKLKAISNWLSKFNGSNFLDQLMPDKNPLIQYNVTGLQAKKIEFNSPFDLYHNTSFPLSALIPTNVNPHSLILSAETIVFNKNLSIGDSAYGNLTLRLPPGGGIPGIAVYKRVVEANTQSATANKVDLDLIDKEARYGLIKFSGVEVVGGGSSINNYINDNIENKTFYFRCTDDGILGIGTEPNTFSIIAEAFGYLNSKNDFRFKALIDNGYLIPATGDDLQDFTDILFIYEEL
ncbi:MAG: hypothetical protein GX808_14370 [Syntrophomonadaceae bacterium]|jgi:hypothetical protein|nr:hypothetical protein [Syntrophomonadaceae bacterium]